MKKIYPSYFKARTYLSLLFLSCCFSVYADGAKSIFSTAETEAVMACITAPAIACPSGVPGCPGASIDPADTGSAVATPGDSACEDPQVMYTDIVESTGPCNDETRIKRMWTANYPNNADPWLISTCTQLLLLEDKQAPTIACPNDVVVATNCNVVNWPAAGVGDNCGTPTLSSNIASGTAFAVGTTTVTYTAQDACGNTSTCNFDVTVQAPCCTAPVITCPADYVGCIDGPVERGNSGFATATSNCGEPLVTYSDRLISTGPCRGAQVIERTWIATEANSGLTSTCIQMITQKDDQVPVINNCPADIVNADNVYNVTWTPPTATDNCGVESFTSSHGSGFTCSPGTTTVTYTAKDYCGNTTVCSFNVTCTQTCTTAPTIICPPDYVGCIDGSVDRADSGFATTSRSAGACGEPLVTYNDRTISEGPCRGAIVIERTWTATEQTSGLSSSCIQMITLADNTAPVISNCPSDIVLPANSNTANWTPPTAADNCEMASFTSNFNPGDPLPWGVETIVYTAIDNCDNTTVCSFTVNSSQACTTPPTIVCPADFVGCIEGSVDRTDAGFATATSGGTSCNEPLVTYSDRNVSTGPCRGAIVIERTWTATEQASGLSSSCIQMITLRDNTAPVINGCPGNITLPANTYTANWTPPTATDDCELASFTSNYDPGDELPCGVTTITYTAVDNCGNTTVCSFTVTCSETCTTAPSINCPSDYIGCLGSGIDPSITGLATGQATGQHCQPPSITYTDQPISSTSCLTEIRRTWIATGSGTGMQSTCFQTITLQDSAPTINNCPSDITTSNADVSWTPPTVSSTCNTYSIASNYAPGATFPCGPTTVIYTVTNTCGNTVTCSFEVNVICNQGSDSDFQDCPADIVVDCNGGNIVTWDIPTFASSCSQSCDVDSIAGFLYMGSYNGNKYFCSTAPATWANANAHAQSLGGHLAHIESAGENQYLANVLTIQSAFIGCSDGVVEGDFIWSDGTPLTYTNWYPGQPNNYQNYQDYCEMLSNGQWNDQYNHVKLEYIMEISCSSVVQTAGPAPGSAFNNGSTTITYSASDGCGNTATCSFDVIVGGGMSLQCIEDQTVECPSDAGVQVTWQEPQMHSCCQQSCTGNSTPQPIAGFIYMGSFGASHYYCSNDPALWPNAQSISQSNGGNLAIIETAAENNFLAGVLAIQSAYIGCSDSSTEGTFQWVNGQNVVYANWYPGQPNDYQQNQDYCELLSSGEWNDQYNNKPLEFIMEIPAGNCNQIVQTCGPANGSVLAPGVHTICYEATDACGNLATCSFDITVTKTSGGNSGSYCTSAGKNSNYAWIKKVKFGPIDNLSGNNGGYKAFGGCTNYQAGGYYDLKLTPGYGSIAYPVYWSIYIDYNQDGDFSDAGEYIATGNGTQTMAGTIKIPSSALAGQTRLRVVMRKHQLAPNACSVFNFGEVEDYCINIVPTTGNLRTGDSNANINGDELESSSINHAGVELGETKAEYRNDRSFDFEDAGQDKEIKIYPNPATEILFLENKAATRASIFDIEGKLVQDIEFAEAINKHQIDVTNLQAGMYTIQVTNDNGDLNTERFTIHHP